MALLRLVALLALTQAVLGANKYCDEAGIWYPDGSRELGNADWSLGPLRPAGPCLQVSGIGMTQTYRKTLLVIDRTDFTEYLHAHARDGPAGICRGSEPGSSLRSTTPPERSPTNTFCLPRASTAQGRGPGGRRDGDGGLYCRARGVSRVSLEPCVDGKCDFSMSGQLTAHLGGTPPLSCCRTGVC